MSDVHELFAGAFAEVGAIAKASQNSHHGYAYRGIDDVMNVLHGVLAKHGLFYTPRCVGQVYEEWQTSKGKRMQVARLDYEFVFYAGDGSSLVVGPVVGQSADTDDKAPMQALSQAAKYALLQAFCIPTEDVADGDAVSAVDAQGGRVAPPADDVTLAAVNEHLDALATPQQHEIEEKTFNAYGISAWNELTQPQADKVLGRLRELTAGLTA